MKSVLKFVLITVMLSLFSNATFAEDLDKSDKSDKPDKQEQEFSGFSLEGVFDGINEQIDIMMEDASGEGGSLVESMLGGKLKGNYALFKNVKFGLTGDFEISSFYYKDKDLNGYNGNHRAFDWEWGKEVRRQTNESVAYITHYLTLHPMLTFANGRVTVHSILENGGYVWEDMFPDMNYHDDEKHEQGVGKSIFDKKKIDLTAVYLEMITPFSAILAGNLPDEMMGVTGFCWVIPLPKLNFKELQLSNHFLALVYGKDMEGEHPLIHDHHNAWDYTISQDIDDFQDKDDITKSGLGVLLNFPPKISTVLFLGLGTSGENSRLAPGASIKSYGFSFNYDTDKLHIKFSLDNRWGKVTNIEDSSFGDYFSLLSNNYGMVIDFLGDENYRNLNVSGGEIAYDFKNNFYLHTSYDMDSITPEVGVLYVNGADTWRQMMNNMARNFEPQANRTPRENLKAYLLNEIEDMYYPLTVTVASDILIQGQQKTSYINMKALKVGATYRINKYLDFYGQVLGAWRTNTVFFEKDYWDTFLMIYAVRGLKEYQEDGMAVTEVPVAVQYANVDYHEEIDPFIGLEFDSKLTFKAAKGLDINLIAAYFKTGGFYEDILTTKPYFRQYMKIKDNELELMSQEFKDGQTPRNGVMQGPYRGSDVYQRADAFTVQLQFDFKFK